MEEVPPRVVTGAVNEFIDRQRGDCTVYQRPEYVLDEKLLAEESGTCEEEGDRD